MLVDENTKMIEKRVFGLSGPRIQPLVPGPRPS